MNAEAGCQWSVSQPQSVLTLTPNSNAILEQLAIARVQPKTALHKQRLFDTPAKRDFLERLLLSFARKFGWQREAWAVFANHYHIVARGNAGSKSLGEFLHDLHGVSAHDLNELDGAQERQVWFNFRDTKLTLQHSYLARLNYVHENAVKHKLVAVANQYPWCSAVWFERVASPAQVKTIYGFKMDRVNVEDDS